MITTDRLLLRHWRASDLCFLSAILGDAEVMEFSDHGALNDHDQSNWLLHASKHQSHQIAPAAYAVERKQDQRVIGYLSLKKDLSRIAETELEIGFRFARSAWGKGYARETVIGICAALDESSVIHQAVAIVDPNNTRSLKVLKNCGFRHQREVMFDGYDYPDHVYAREAGV